MPETGDLIGHVRLGARLGAGGMGEVWEGSDERLGRTVAVKMIRHDHRLGDGARARFAREAQILSRLEHENICRLYELIETDTFDVLVMERVSGRTLKDALQDGLRPGESLSIAIGICSALVAAHSLSVVHRDLKPENVMLTAGGEVKVLDFGLARLLADDVAASTPDRAPPADGTYLSPSPAVTRAGDILGTPHYMSPEQARGEPVTAASDMFAFGLLLYELYTGKPPYASESFIEVLQRARWGDVPAITGVSRPIGSLIRSLVELHPGQRPTATGTLERLHRLRERPMRRLRTAAVAVAAASLVLGTVFSLVGLTQARREAALASATTDFLVRVFTTSDPEREAGGNVTARELLDRGAARINTELAGQPATRARLLLTLGRIHNNLGMPDRAADLLEQALAIQEGLYARDDRTLLDILLPLASSYAEHGAFKRSREVLERALTIADRTGDRAREADASISLASLLQRTGHLDEADPVARHALDLARSVHGIESQPAAAAASNLATLLLDRGKPAGAEPLLIEALQILDRLHGAEHPDSSRVALNLATCRKELGRFAEAEALYRRSLASFEHRLGTEHPQTAIAHNDLGVVLLELGRIGEAEAKFERATAIADRSLGRTHPVTGILRSNLAEATHLLGRLAQAEALFEEAIEVEKAGFGAQHPAVAESLRGLGMVVADSGRLEEAERLLQESLTMRQSLAGAENPDYARSLADLGRLYRFQGRIEDAASALTRASLILEQTLGTNHPHTLRARSDAAAVGGSTPSDGR